MNREKAKHIYEPGFEFVYLIIQNVNKITNINRQLTETNRQLTETNRQLTETNRQLEIRVKKLEDQLSRDSHNSSKPPSSDGLKRSNRNKSLRNRSSKSSGGQKGHRGTNLKRVQFPNKIIKHDVDACESCGSKNITEGKVSGKDKRQVFDIPSVKMEVTEHQVSSCVCKDCGHKSKADFPAGVNSLTQYGVNIKTFIVALNLANYLPSNRLVRFIKEWTGHEMSEGTIYNIIDCFNEKTKEFYESLREKILDVFVVGADETSIRCQKRNYWLHCLCSNFFSFFYSSAKRGAKAMIEGGVLNRYQGIVVHDDFNAYYVSDFKFNHSLCNVHLLRSLVFEYENNKQDWAKEMKDFLLMLKKRVDDNGGFVSSDVFIEMAANYDAIVKEGLARNPLPKRGKNDRGRLKKSSTLNLLFRFRDKKDLILRFAKEKDVPFDNNESERSLRMAKVKQKISGGFRSDLGRENFCQIHTYLQTARKQNKNLFAAIQSAFKDEPIQICLG